MENLPPRIRGLRLCMVLAFACFSSVWPSEHVATSVFQSGVGGYTCYRIPTLLPTLSGTLLAIVEARKDSCADWAEIDIVLRRSEDGGKTWSDLELVVAGRFEEHVTAGNFAPVQDRTSSRLLMPFTRGNWEFWFTSSDDDGRTWEEPKHLSDLKPATWNWVGFGPPAAIQLTRGRIVVPLHASRKPYFEAGALGFAAVVYSDDGGDNWKGPIEVSEGIAPFLTCSWANENQVAQLADGSLLMNARTLCGGRLQSRSFDHGETWSELVRVDMPQPLNGCEGSLIALHGSSRVVFSGVYGNARKNLSLWASESGEHWTPRFVVDSGPSAYSSLAQLSDDSIGIVWESSGGEVAFARIPVQVLDARPSTKNAAIVRADKDDARNAASEREAKSIDSGTLPSDPRTSAFAYLILIVEWVLLVAAWALSLILARLSLIRCWDVSCVGSLLRMLYLLLLVASTFLVIMSTVFFSKDDAVRWRRDTFVACTCCLLAVTIPAVKAIAEGHAGRACSDSLLQDESSFRSGIE
eukprot:TRINITY_DN48464_c0_g1_i1.p1 TRINITY_DN48464_c0_g1~~TRINITY_DN48464_c0_g1_i1.p1  ORF type:complete len:543 (-),score=66.25 TRINITY_DN48464_c0_g1_i1:136-1707(-)